VYTWNASNHLVSFDLATGQAMDLPLTARHSLSGSEFRSLAPVLQNNLLVVVVSGAGRVDDEGAWTELSVLDAPTGAILWQVDLKEATVGSVRVEDNSVVLPHHQHLGIYNIVDGSPAGTRPTSAVSLKERLSPGHDKAVTPVVSLDGKLYYGTKDRGRIICLGVGQP
jgi:hypothetical protein